MQRKLQSRLHIEDTVDYRRACTAHFLEKADIYTKIIDHLNNEDDVYYNRGTFVAYKTYSGDKWATL